MSTGQVGFLDWVGYSVGVPPPVCGFSGLLDWAGYPVGVALQPPTPPAVSGGGAGGGSGTVYRDKWPTPRKKADAPPAPVRQPRIAVRDERIQSQQAIDSQAFVSALLLCDWDVAEALVMMQWRKP